MELKDQWFLLGCLLFLYILKIQTDSLKFIGILDGESKPKNGVISYERWLELEKEGR